MNPSTASSITSSVWTPIRVDLVPFLPNSSPSEGAKLAAAQAIRQACETDGLFLLDYRGWVRTRDVLRVAGPAPSFDIGTTSGGAGKSRSSNRSTEKHVAAETDDSKEAIDHTCMKACGPINRRRLSSYPRVLDAIASFFALPLQEKEALPSLHSQGFSRGYIPVLGESGLKGQFVEWKEGFSMGYESADGGDEGSSEGARDPSAGAAWGQRERADVATRRASSLSPSPQNPLEGPNVWPTSSTALAALRGGGTGKGGTAWREEMQAFFVDMIALSRALSRALSLALGREEGWLEAVCGEGGERISLLRAFHYMSSSSLPPSIPPSRALGSSPHTDWGLFTIILQQRQESIGEEEGDEEEGGLQFRGRPQGARVEAGEEGEELEWVRVPWVAETLIVNCGDFLAMLSERLVAEGKARAGGRREGGREGASERGRRPFHSPVHRVTLSPSRDRTSLVFFFYPSYDTPMPAAGREGLREERRDGGRGGKGHEYNTLRGERGETRGEGGHVSPLTFGEHLARKWAGVKSS